MVHHVDTDPDIAIIIAALLCAFLVYFLPTFVAFFRHHHNRMAILVFNLFLGVSGIGWVAALVWAFTFVKEQPIT
jgi:ABC-type transport system involved in cytochrome c biogenesis permease component